MLSFVTHKVMPLHKVMLLGMVVTLFMVSFGAQAGSTEGPGGTAGTSPSSVNIALGKPYTFSVAPNYSYCTDAGDLTQLTDGEYTTGYFWVQKGTVGWTNRSPVITIDLQAVEPISGLSYSTAAGVAGVFWPRAIPIFVSDDGEEFYYAGELIQMSSENGLPSPTGYSTHRYRTTKLITHGRYVRLVVIPTGSYTFCDEIEVYRGPEGFLELEPGKKIEGSIDDFVKGILSESGLRNRLLMDLGRLRQRVEEARIDGQIRQELLAELARIAPEIPGVPAPPSGFRAIIPLNSLHARMFQVNARLLRACGLPRFIVWHKNRWDMLEPTESPSAEKAEGIPQLEVAMMSNEYRSEAFNMTNATDEPLVVKLRIEGLPLGANPGYITVHQVEFVDTREGVVIADALPLARKTEDGFEVDVPSGMTRQVWLTFNPTDIEPGVYDGRIVVMPGNGMQDVSIPLRFRLFPFRFPDRPSISLGVWDYTDTCAYDITPENRDEAIRNMRQHFVDTPWAQSGTAPWPSSFQFEGGRLKLVMDFSRFDKWVTDWKGSRNYYIFLSVGDTFGPTREHVGSEFFEMLVSLWAREWAEHIREIGLRPSQFGLLLVDEPHSQEQDRRITAWARAIKAGAPEFVIWEDPTHLEPWKASREMFEVCDVLCPNLSIYYRGGERTREFFKELQEQGKGLWFYQCAGPARLLDPYYYHRLQHWHAWIQGATGSGFWAYGDAGGASPWNEYEARVGTSYTPVYLDEDSVTDGKHWEAVREGIEDYEYLRMLRDRVNELKEAGFSGKALEEAELLLQDAPVRVAGKFEDSLLHWSAQKDRSVADIERVRILEALERLREVVRP